LNCAIEYRNRVASEAIGVDANASNALIAPAPLALGQTPNLKFAIT
jgi:hypothetical protein